MSSAPVILAAAGSHLYRGARGDMRGAAAEGPCLAEFGDGSVAFGRLTAADGRMVLELDAYATARGTEIPAKRWVVAISGTGAERRYRILARLPSACG